MRFINTVLSMCLQSLVGNLALTVTPVTIYMCTAFVWTCANSNCKSNMCFNADKCFTMPCVPRLVKLDTYTEESFFEVAEVMNGLRHPQDYRYIYIYIYRLLLPKAVCGCWVVREGGRERGRVGGWAGGQRAGWCEAYFAVLHFNVPDSL